MSGELIVVLSVLLLIGSLAGRRAEALNLTPPMMSVVAGAVVFASTDLVDFEAEQVLVIAELTLVMVLFHDASTVRLRQLRLDPWIAVRLLAVGFPIALAATAVSAWAMVPALGVAGAVLLAGSVTPTDAGLGAPTVLNPAVPVRVRRALNVESGLNDGLATPIVLLAVAALAAEEGEQTASVFSVSVVPVTLAVVLAVVVGLLAAWALDASRRTRWSSRHGRTVAMLAIPVVLFGAAEVAGANAFIAAFVGGLVVGSAARTVDEEEPVSMLVESASELLGFVVWFLGGGLLVTVFRDGASWTWIVLAVLVLTVLRVVPVALSLLGMGLRAPTVLFFGWFGPRGLASIVFALIAVEELGVDHPVIDPVAGVIGATVLLSVFAHGLSAAPLCRRYASWLTTVQAPIEVQASVEPMASRGRPTA